MRQWKLCKTEQEKTEYRKQRRLQYDTVTQEQKLQRKLKRQKDYQKWLNSLTQEQLQEHKNKQRQSFDRSKEMMSPEKKIKLYNTIRKNAHDKYAQLPLEQKQQRSIDRRNFVNGLPQEEILRRKEVAAKKASAKALRIKTKVINHYSHGIMRCMNPKCEVPGGTKNIIGLCIDHINGGGREEMRKLGMRGGTAFYLWLIRNNYPKGYQVLCATCNIIKVAENKENWHRYKREQIY
jgi:hypothetical protein